MTTLRQTQAALADYLFHQATGMPTPAGRLIDAHPPANPDQRLQVYRRNTLGAQAQALAPTYPVIHALLGETCFAGLSRHYARTHPSSRPDLNHYGERFSEFLSDQVLSKVEFCELPYLADLAVLEWRAHQAYFQADDPAFKFEAFSDQAASGKPVRLQLASSLSLQQSHYPVRAIWQAHQQKEPDQLRSITPLPDPENLLIWRNDLRLEVLRIEVGMFKLLREVSRGTPLSELAITQADVPMLLPSAIAAGWIVSFHCGIDDV